MTYDIGSICPVLTLPCSFRYNRPVPQTVNYTKNKGQLLWRLITYLKANGGSKPVMVMHTVCAAATTLASYLEQEAGAGRLGDLQPHQIKLVSAKTQLQAWQRQFLANPNKHIAETRVLIVTPTMQAGHSVDCHIGKFLCAMLLCPRYYVIGHTLTLVLCQ
jgi:hypothetical protein